MNEKELLNNFIDETRQTMNPSLFSRSDGEIIEQLENAILSCQRENPYFTIKVEGFRVVDSYEEIHNILREYYKENYNKKNKSNKKADNPYDYIDINRSAIRLLIVSYYISAVGDKEPADREKRFDVIIAVPRIVDKYYFLINGIMRSTLYQIVDGSTYNRVSYQRNPVITTKTNFMAVRVARYHAALTTDTGDVVDCINYSSRIFKKSVQAPKYIFAKYGFYGAMQFFGINDIIISQKAINDDNIYNFKKADGLFVCVPKRIFDEDGVVQSICSMLYSSMIPGVPFELYFTTEFWVRSLGADFNTNMASKMSKIVKGDGIQDTISKGYSVLDSFESIYDISCKENSIRLPEEQKADMYCVLRWILREFNKLRLKDNLDISIKRIRFAEYCASLYVMKIVRGIYRIADMGNKATADALRKAIRTNPMYLLVAISKCRMVTYRNMTSDMDAITALKFTYRGISGLGENNNQSIPTVYRRIHPSHVGRVDLDASSDGNPGMTGIISPFTNIYDGGFFTDYTEPNEWEESFKALVDEDRKARNIIEPLIFQNKVLGIDNNKEINQSVEAYYSARHFMEPIINSNEGDIIFELSTRSEYFNGD